MKEKEYKSESLICALEWLDEAICRLSILVSNQVQIDISKPTNVDVNKNKLELLEKLVDIRSKISNENIIEQKEQK